MPLLPSSKVAIIGGGISGIIAALELEKNGFSPTVFEKSDRLGGRLKTDFFEDIPLDHGFQVLLTQYPELRKYLDYAALELHHFRPAALIFESSQKHHLLGDALRDFSLLWPTLTSSCATFSDKLKLLLQQRKIAQKSVDEIFGYADKRPTMTVLSDRYSQRFIEQFFIPFYGGIFLDKTLRVSNVHFEFVFHMFSKGYAAIPKRGIESVVDQLVSQLKSTTIKLRTAVDPSTIKSDFDVVIQAHADSVAQQWFSTEVFYFKCADNNRLVSTLENTIGLFPNSDSVNSIHALRGSKSTLISATVVGSAPVSDGSLEQKVRQEVCTRTGLSLEGLVGHYTIEQALPVLRELRPHLDVNSDQSGLFHAGDHLLYPSLNAAMTSGREAAQRAIATKS